MLKILLLAAVLTSAALLFSYLLRRRYGKNDARQIEQETFFLSFDPFYTTLSMFNPYGSMLLNMDKKAKEQLQQTQTDAKAVKEWINNNPDASESDIREKKTELKEKLQSIADTVTEPKA